jgi:F0F1-type ATP synthase membrane subunit b/b'
MNLSSFLFECWHEQISFFVGPFTSLSFANEEIGLELNPNFLETNIINLAILFGLLIYGFQSSVTENLEKRRHQIIQRLENAQSDLVKASDYYEKASKGYAQSFFWLQSWKTSYEKQKIEIIGNKYKQTKNRLTELFFMTEILMLNVERKTFLALQRYILLVSASKILSQFLCLSSSEKSRLIDSILKTLK